MTAPGVEVARILPHGLCLVVDGREVFLSFEEFPWFRDAPASSILNVHRPHPEYLRWPDLDVDLALDCIGHPERYPLVAGPEDAVGGTGEDGHDPTEALRRDIRRIQERFARLPVLDDRSPDEILGYDENGLPT